MHDMRRYVHITPRNGTTSPQPGTSSSSLQANASFNNGRSNQIHLLDIGSYVDKHQIDEDLRFKLLKKPWKPDVTYNFKKDVDPNAKAFQVKWLNNYNWLAYSAEAKGPLCRICVLFGHDSSAHNGLPVPFVNFPYLKYDNLPAKARSHQKSKIHLDSVASSETFRETMETKNREYLNERKQEYGMQLQSIVAAILFCGKHILPFDEETVVPFFTDLLHFRTDAKNASRVDDPEYTIRNKLVETCSDVLRSDIIEEVNHASVFSVLVDETFTMNGEELLPIGVRYIHRIEDGNPIIREELLGCVPIQHMEAGSITNTIVRFLTNCKFNLNKLVGQGYDGCTAIANYIGNVQKNINDKYPPALLFHCAGQVLNHVINDVNDVSDVRLTSATTNDIINFIKENTQHIRQYRNEISDVPFISRNPKPHESNRLFSSDFYNLMLGLDELSRNAPNPKTRTKAYQLYNTATNPAYIVTMLVIARYSAKLEPTCQNLQEEYLNINNTFEHINELINYLENQRNNSSTEFAEVYEKALYIYALLDIECTQPRVKQQTYERSKHENVQEFFRTSIFVPYLDSLISYLRIRFSSNHKIAFSVMQLHPENIRKLDKPSFCAIAEEIQNFYGDLLTNFVAEATTWYEQCTVGEQFVGPIALSDLIGSVTTYYPSVRKAFEIALSIPPTSDVRIFNTLRRVKKWNRLTEGHGTLIGLFMLSYHRERVEEDDQFINKVIEKYEQGKGQSNFFFNLH